LFFCYSPVTWMLKLVIKSDLRTEYTSSTYAL
jgi:hypothetical protein